VSEFPLDPPEPIEGSPLDPPEPIEAPLTEQLSSAPKAAADAHELSAAPSAAETFTSGEKVRSLLDVAFSSPTRDKRARAAISAIKTAQRFRLLNPIIDIFPPLDDPQAWDEWIVVAVGVALNLLSDDFELVDVDLYRVGQQVLAQLYADVEADANRG
jgi:hypothetical protein